MAKIKVLKVDANADYTEHSESGDSIELASLFLSTSELTGTKLGDLIDGADAADQHIHDARYYRQDQFIDASTGVADAGKPIETNASGLLDETFLDLSLLDHDSLNNVANSTAHLAFPLLAGGREFTAKQAYDQNFAYGANDLEIPDVKFVKDSIAQAEMQGHWQKSVLDRAVTPPGSPSTGDRYLIDAQLGTATGDWAGNEDKIAEWDGSAWTYTTSDTGFKVSALDEPDRLYYFGGVQWEAKLFESTTASNGLVKVGLDIQLNPTANEGIEVDISGQAKVRASDLVGEGIIEDGSNNFAIDWSTTYNDSKAIKASDLSSTANGRGASIIGIEDVNDYFTATTQEGVNNELFEALEIAGGVVYVAGAGGVSKGDLVYISGNNTVLPLDISVNNVGIGVAFNDALVGEDVKVVNYDFLIDGVLTGATFGTKYFWDGTGYVTTYPAAAGAYVWELGAAKNATDLVAKVRFIKRNAV